MGYPAGRRMVQSINKIAWLKWFADDAHLTQLIFLFPVSSPLAVTLQASLYAHIRTRLEGIILTSPAVRVKPAHPIVGVIELFLFKYLLHEHARNQHAAHFLNHEVWIGDMHTFKRID